MPPVNRRNSTATEDAKKKDIKSQDVGSDVVDPVTGETNKALSLTEAQDADTLKSVLGVDADDDEVNRHANTVAAAAQWRQTLDVRDPALSQPVVYVGSNDATE